MENIIKYMEDEDKELPYEKQGEESTDAVMNKKEKEVINKTDEDDRGNMTQLPRRRLTSNAKTNLDLLWKFWHGNPVAFQTKVSPRCLLAVARAFQILRNCFLNILN